MSSLPASERVLAVLRARRSMARVSAEPLPRELVEQVLAPAAWAPNHHRTQPWQFVVLTGDARIEMGAIMAESLRSRLDDGEGDEGLSPESASLLEKERSKPLRAPVLVAAAAIPSQHPKAIEVEEIAATAAAVQNMLLAAEALGLGAMWRTGTAAYDPTIKEFLGLPGEAHLIGFIYLGYPDLPEVPERRDRTLEGHIRWMN